MQVMTPVASPADSRQYRHITTDNALQILLISDPTTDRIGAAVACGVGSLSDPLSLPGLAHFCEHMLLQGSVRRPEGRLQKFVDAHGGESNAYTASTETVYYFDLSADAEAKPGEMPPLEEGLDILASAFVNPLLDPTNTKDEVQAVNGEFKMHIKEDGWRLAAVEKQALWREGHPIRKFDCGNVETLDVKDPSGDPRGELLRADLAAWQAAHYAARHVRVVVMSTASLDEMQERIVPMFVDVPDFDFDRFHFLDGHEPIWKHVDESAASLQIGSIAEPAYHCCRVDFEPVQDRHSLKIMWPTPAQGEKYRTKPDSYLSHVIGHEAAGSVFWLLKQLGWVSALSAGPQEYLPDTECVIVSCNLTNEGAQHIDDIVAIICAFVRLLVDEGGFIRWIWDETQSTRAVSWRFMEKMRCTSYLTILADRLFRNVPRGEILSAPYLVGGEPDYALIEKDVKDLLRYLVPENMSVIVMSPSGEKSELENVSRHVVPHYQCSYTRQNLSENKKLYARLQLLAHDSAIDINSVVAEIVTEACFVSNACRIPVEELRLRLPERNRFIADQFDVKEEVDDEVAQLLPPSKISADEMLTSSGSTREAHAQVINNSRDDMIVLHKAANIFRKPRAHLSIQIASPLLYASPYNVICGSLLCELLQDYLNDELSYYAEMAGLKFSLSSVYEGIELTISGYDQKCPDLAICVLETLVEAIEQGISGKVGADVVLHEARFNVLVEQFSRQFRNQAIRMQPYHISSLVRRKMMLETFWGHEEKLLALTTHRPGGEMRLKDVCLFGSQLLARARLMLLGTGNLRRTEMALLAERVLQTLKPASLVTSAEPPGLIRNSAAEISMRRTAMWPRGTTLHASRVHHSSDKNNCAWVSMQFGPATARNEVLCVLLAQILMNPAYEQLRTIETLGYVVWATSSSDGTATDLSFVVQSPDFDPEYLRRRIDNFSRYYASVLKDMDEATFATQVAGTRAVILKKFEKLSEEHAFCWNEMVTGTPRFKRRELQAEALSRLTLDEVRRDYEAKVLNLSTRRRLVSEVWGADQTFPDRNSEAMEAMYRVPDMIVEGTTTEGSAPRTGLTDVSAEPVVTRGKHTQHVKFAQLEPSTERLRIVWRGEERLWQGRCPLWPAEVEDYA